MSKAPNFDAFQITEKHYNTIIKQGLDNLPKESGGFLGGNSDGLVQAIMPVYNQYLFDRTGTFMVTSEDIQRAHAFFQKHDMLYYSVYHTHPNGIAYPSAGDIKTGHKYHFIVSYVNKEQPEFAAYRIDNNSPVQLPLTVVSDKGFSSASKKGAKSQVKLDDRDALNERISNIIYNKPNRYDRMDPPDNSDSDFSTLA